ncbi:MAG: transposase [Thiotrichales bacterium]|nr:transposase [Thiotrichales bacterium]
MVEHIDQLRFAFKTVSVQSPFTIDAIVILPEHLHTIWTLPKSDDDYPSAAGAKPNRWRAIKSLFTRTLKKEGVKLRKNSRGEYQLWQRRYWEHTLHSENDLQSHIDYIHYNPVKHGLVSSVCEWPHSSFHRYVKDGLLDVNWSDDINIYSNSNFGE